MSASTTHDTKRGEDMRARLNVLSEIPDEWEQTIGRWRYMNAAHKADLEGTSVPDPNEAYLIYQTLVGTWPYGGTAEPFRPDREYVDRIVRYCEKAFREAKLHTSWLDPDSDYEHAIFEFVRAVLDPQKSAEFLEELEAFVARIADAGYLNGLAQALVKATAPGVPDFYQGTELWDFRLVDPDNRGPVNFGKRKEQLSEIAAHAERDPAGLASELLDAWPDERIKLLLTWRALELRKARPDRVPPRRVSAAPDHGRTSAARVRVRPPIRRSVDSRRRAAIDAQCNTPLSGANRSRMVGRHGARAA